MSIVLSYCLTFLAYISFFLSPITAFHFGEGIQDLEIRQNISPRDAAQQVRQKIIEEGFEFIEPQSFFAVSGNCKTDTRDLDENKWSNRFDFYKQAIHDATQISKAAEKWPQFGGDASDLYMYKGLDTDERRPYAENITKNIKKAAHWDNPQWGFDPYIVYLKLLDVPAANVVNNRHLPVGDDPYKACNNKIGKDPRSIACYVNNTRSFWWTKSQVSCCGPFFTIKDNKEAFDYANSKNISKLGLDWMRTSGSYLVHEMMHTVQITEKRPRVVDSTFLGGSGRRIYGPKDCAKAAKTEELDVNAFNADSYAEFMLGMYWKDLFQGHLFKPESDPDLLESPPDIDPKTPDLELVSDNDANYIDFGAQTTQPQLICAGEPKDKSSTTRDWVAAQIDDYCNQITSQSWIVNSTLGRYGPKGYAAGEVAPNSENDLWLSISHDPDCDVNTGYEVELSPCREYFNMALNECNTESKDKKWGGMVQANCALWNITTRAGRDSTPPNGIPPTPQVFPNG